MISFFLETRERVELLLYQNYKLSSQGCYILIYDMSPKKGIASKFGERFGKDRLRFNGRST